MMRFVTLIVMLVCISASGNLQADPAVDDSETTTTQQAGPEQHRPPVIQAPRKAAKPATTFKPSEKIGADSAVSFPVDI